LNLESLTKTTKFIILGLACVDLTFFTMALFITYWSVKSGFLCETNPSSVSLFASVGLLSGILLIAAYNLVPVVACLCTYFASPKLARRLGSLFSDSTEKSLFWVKCFQLFFFVSALIVLGSCAFRAIPDGWHDLIVLIHFFKI